MTISHMKEIKLELLSGWLCLHQCIYVAAIEYKDPNRLDSLSNLMRPYRHHSSEESNKLGD